MSNKVQSCKHAELIEGNADEAELRHLRLKGPAGQSNDIDYIDRILIGLAAVLFQLTVFAQIYIVLSRNYNMWGY